MEKYGLEAPNREKHTAKGGISRGRLEELVAAGMSITEISDTVQLSKGTVRHWLTRHGLRTRATERVAAERAARDAGQADLTLIASATARPGS